MRLPDLTPSLTRRLALGFAALAAAPPTLPVYAARPLSSDELLRKLSRVPIFVVTNREDSPYLTEVDGQGRRSGLFFLGPQEAVAALNDIKGFDPRASISVVSLDSVWFTISKSAEEAASAPQPTAGTSTDMRLFRIRPLEDTAAGEDRSKIGSKLALDDVPLFYDSTYLLDVDGTQQRPYFFRLADLRKSYQEQSGRKLADPPSVRLATLAGLVKSLQAGDDAASPPPLLVAASDASAVVERMAGASAASESSGAGATPAAAEGNAASRLAPTESALGSTDGDPFFLNVPFGNGKVK